MFPFIVIFIYNIHRAIFLWQRSIKSYNLREIIDNPNRRFFCKIYISRIWTQIFEYSCIKEQIFISRTKKKSYASGSSHILYVLHHNQRVL